jgi:hypothetical protein
MCGCIIIIKTLAELFERSFQGQLRGEVINTATASKIASSTVQRAANRPPEPRRGPRYLDNCVRVLPRRVAPSEGK